MLRRSILLTAIFALTFGASARCARADIFTTETATVNQNVIPAGVPVLNVLQINAIGGISYDNNISTTGAPGAGNIANIVAAVPIVNYNTSGGGVPSAVFGGGARQGILVFAGQAQVTSIGGGGATASLQFATPGNTLGGLAVGKIGLFDVANGTFNTLHPTTWGNPLAAVALFGIKNNEDVIPGSGLGVTRPAAIQNQASINAANPLANQGFVLFKDINDPFVLEGGVPLPGFFKTGEGISARLDQEFGTFSPDFGAADLAALNAFSNALAGFQFATGFGPGPATNFNPQNIGATIPPDFFLILGAQAAPGIQQLPEGEIPEPASMLLWGLMAVGIGIYGGIRRYQSKRADAVV